MLYIFAGFPGKGAGPGTQHLHAGGLQHAIETVEELAILEHDPVIQHRKEGVFANETGELLRQIEYRLSDSLLKDGITWDWFTEGWRFGNGVTVQKSMASPAFSTVVHGSDLTLDQFLALHGPTRLADLELFRKHNRTESWESYESRWLPGTCPQENHEVSLTVIVTDYRLPEFAYERIRDLIERRAEPKYLDQYSAEQGKHFHTIRRYGK